LAPKAEEKKKGEAFDLPLFYPHGRKSANGNESVGLLKYRESTFAPSVRGLKFTSEVSKTATGTRN
jgi:hypothetical protein